VAAQLSIFIQISGLVEAAKNSVDSASAIAGQADSVAVAKQEYYNYQKAFAKPLENIEVFTQSNPKGILQPLLYQEKPAYGTGKTPIDFSIPSIIALTIFQGAVMGMGRAIAGEKKEGSLTRVFLTPTSNITIIIGTLLFYILFELFRSVFILLVAISLFHVAVEGSIFSIGIILAIYAGVSTSIGMIISSMVKTEQQFQGMAMLVSMPTIFLSGAFFPLQAMPKFLQVLAAFLPVTYGGDALRGVMIKGFPLSMISYQLLVLCLFLIASFSIVMIVFRRDIE
jgi:ABC-2 type transport system permease protein